MHLSICCKSRLRNRQIQFKISVGSLIGNGGVKTDRIIYDTRKVKVLSPPEILKEKSTFRAKALRRESLLTPDKGPLLETTIFL